MTSTILFYIIIGIIFINFISDKVLGALNAKHFNDTLPTELEDVYDKKEYEKSQSYKATNYKFSNITSIFSLILTLAFFYFDGFEYVDTIARIYSENPIIIALLFFGIIMMASDIISTPFSYYKTFVIEERFGFNKSTKKLFIIDKIKGLVMMAIIGGGLLALIVWFYQATGTCFWLYAWGLITVFTVFMNMFYARLIVPLFNKQKPLEDGELRNKISDYAISVGFSLKKILLFFGPGHNLPSKNFFNFKVSTSEPYIKSHANMLVFQKRPLGPFRSLFGLWSWISNLLSVKSWSHWRKIVTISLKL